jgi:hypothetical protein
MHSARDLCTRIVAYRGRSIDLWPTNYTPPEPRELAEAKEAFSAEILAPLIKETVDPASWCMEGPALDFKAGILIARTAADEHDAIDHLLATLRTQFLQRTRVRAAVVTMPLASLPEYWTGLDDASLVADGGAALIARAGAKVVDRAALRLARQQRDACITGRARSYVGDYDVEIATGALVANPRILQAFEGTCFDVQAVPTARGGGVLAEIRLDRATLRETRKAPTAFGEIECPSHGVLRMHGSTVIPLGATRLVCANLDGDQVTLVLVSAAGD